MKIFKNLGIILVITFILFLPVLSFAQNNGNNPPQEGNGTNPPVSDIDTGVLKNPINSNSIPQLVHTILEGVVKIGLPIIVIAIIYSGFLFVAAQGNPEKISDARRSLMYTLIGAAILLGSWAIAQLISETVKAL